MNRLLLQTLQVSTTNGLSVDDKRILVENAALLFAAKPASNFDMSEIGHIKNKAQALGLDYKKVLCDALMMRYYPNSVAQPPKQTKQSESIGQHTCNCGRPFATKQALSGHRRSCKK